MQPKALVPIAAGGALILLGVALGNWIGVGSTSSLAASETATHADLAAELRAIQGRLEALTEEVRALRSRRPTSAATDLDHAPEPVPESTPTRAPVLVARDEKAAQEEEPSTDTAGSGAAPALDAILARLESIEATQRLVLGAGAPAPGRIELQMPTGMAVRDFLQALKYSGFEQDVKRAHLFWDMERVRRVYGEPDEVADRGDYVEWIYRLREEGTQFDFHFVNGLAVEAH